MKNKKRFSVIVGIILLGLLLCPAFTYANNETNEMDVNSTTGVYFDLTKKYDEDKNTVTVTITSESILVKNKDASWQYSDDCHSISKVYYENTSYYTVITNNFGIAVDVFINITEIKELKVETEEIYNESTNSSTIRLTSNIKLKKDKDVSWNYSEDLLSISKEYTENTNYYTAVHDIYGNSIDVNIIVNKIQNRKLSYTISNRYDENKNIVLVTVKSNNELLKNKDASWVYSEDLLSISKEYTENTNYYTTISDVYGNSIKVNIIVNEIQDKKLSYTISNRYDENKNIVLVTVKSNNELLKNKDASWIYSDDSLTISKEYTENTNYYTTINDIYGNSIRVNIIVTEIQKNELRITAEEIYDELNNTSTIKLISNNELRKDKDVSWEYSDDLLSISKEYTENTNYYTIVHDIYGNPINVNIIVNKIQDRKLLYTISNSYNEEDNTVIVTIKTNNKLLKNKDASWKYSDDLLTISKEYLLNTDYYTTITDIYGNSQIINIKVNEIDPIPCKIVNTYNEEENVVVVSIISKNKLMKNKDASWVYSDDSFTILKVYTENTDYFTYITDINGNSKKINIKVTEIKNLQLNVNKSYNSETNTVKIVVSSNLKLLKDKDSSWTYSEDQLSASKEFNININQDITFSDIYGENANININISEIDDKAPIVEIIYEFLDDGKILVKIQSNEPLQANKNPDFWILSDDRLTYSRIYNENAEDDYVTTVNDIYNNQSSAYIKFKIKNFDDQTNNINIKYVYCSNEIEYVIVNSLLQFKDTKSDGGWRIFNNGYSYIKEYNRNTNYETTFTFIDETQKNVNICALEIDDKVPTVIVDFEFLDNGKIAVKIKSNKKLLDNKNNAIWSLSTDKLTYTRIYDTYIEEDYTTFVRDLHDNEVNVYIKMKIKDDNYNQNDNTLLNVKYVYCSNNVAYVVLNSSVKLLDTKSSGGWKYFNNGYSYVKGYTENTVYKTDIKNINNTITTIPIVITYFKNVLEGIDVSSHNGVIDWSRVKDVDFAIIRAGYRGYTVGSLNEDANFKYNVNNANANGIKVGLYFYSQAINEQEARDEADYVISLIRKYNLKIEFPIAIDIEAIDKDARAENLSVDERTRVCIAFCDRIREAGYTPMVYSNKNWLTSYIDTNRLNYDIWLAQYNDTVTYNGGYVMWQYTSSGNVDGISGNVDKNHLYKNYI